MYTGFGAFVLATLVLAIAGTSSIGGQRDVLTEQERESIANLPVAFAERSLAGDWDGVAALYHEDAIQMPPDAPAIEGRENIRDSVARLFGPENGIRLKDLALEVLEISETENLVYVRAAYHFTFATTAGAEEAVFEQYGPYVNILQPDDSGTWLIYRQIYNRDHPPPGDPARTQ